MSALDNIIPAVLDKTARELLLRLPLGSITVFIILGIIALAFIGFSTFLILRPKKTHRKFLNWLSIATTLTTVYILLYAITVTFAYTCSGSDWKISGQTILPSREPHTHLLVKLDLEHFVDDYPVDNYGFFIFCVPHKPYSRDKPFVLIFIDRKTNPPKLEDQYSFLGLEFYRFQLICPTCP